MIGRWTLASVLVGAVAFSGLLCGTAAWAKDKEIEKAAGILVDKDNDNNWIEVKADGDKEAKRYHRMDKDAKDTLKSLVVANRVELEWIKKNDKRVLDSVKMIVPTEKTGVVTGEIVDKGEHWIDVKADGDTAVERYSPRWVGGSPKEGGALEKDMVRKLGDLKVGEKVKINWTYDDRKCATQVDPAGPAGKKK